MIEGAFDPDRLTAIRRITHAASMISFQRTWVVRAPVMSQRNEFRANCAYYGEKCRKHLCRIKLSRKLALDRLEQLLDAGEAAHYEPLLRESLDAQELEAPRLREMLVKVIIESHFLTLKVNFEYFLNRMLYCLWSSQLDQLAQGKTRDALKQRVPLHDFAQALSGQGGREFVISAVIPAHGLDRMAQCFEDTTGKSLPQALKAESPSLWSQIDSAFEVRHLIEHRKGKVDQCFLERVASHALWKNSSWADFPLSIAAKIEVREKDFDATCAAMMQAGEIVTALTSDCWVG